MKKLLTVITILICMVMSGCGAIKFKGDSLQIVTDTMIEAGGIYAMNDLARHIKKNHPEDVQRYISYCEKILVCTDKDQVESYLNIGMDYIIESNIADKELAVALKGMFDVDVETNLINFDSGSLRVGVALVEALKAALEV